MACFVYVNQVIDYLLYHKDSIRIIVIHVLNPITGEYMPLPDCESQRAFKRYHGDFGFCPKINQFKAVRVFYLSHYGNDQRAGLHGMVGIPNWDCNLEK